MDLWCSFRFCGGRKSHEIFHYSRAASTATAIAGMGRPPPAPAQTLAGHCAQRKKGQTMNTGTAELAAIETVIVLVAVILLGTLTVAWVIFGPFDVKRKKGNSRSLKRKR